jgi:class 3 adenylate cyclase
MKQKDYRLAAIVFTDIHGFSRMMERDEAGTLALLHMHNDLVAGVVKAHGGVVIKTIGDAFLLDFKNTVDALQSALEIQDKLYQYNKEHSDLPLLVRIGVHLGDIYFFENDALGEGINIASRLQSIAHPGCICMSQDVYNLVLNKIDFQATKLGRVSLKNISKEIHAYEITTPNVEFDPEHGKPRPGYKPGSFAGKDDGMEFIPEADIKPTASQVLEANTSESAKEARQALEGGPAEDSSGQTDLRRILDSVKRSILADIKALGRRMSVEEARAKYSVYGPEVETAISDLAAKGILQRGSPASVGGAAPESRSASAAAPAEPGGQARRDGSYTERFRSIGMQIVDEVARSIENGIQRGGGRHRAAHQAPRSHAGPFGPAAPSSPAAPSANQAAMEMSYDFGDPKVRAMSTRWERKLANTPFSSIRENYIQDFGIYKDSVAAAAKRSRSSFIPNVASWAGVSAMLFFINSFGPGFHVPWALIPFFAWGSGVVEHFFALRRKAEKALEIENMPALNPDQLALFKRIHLSKDAFVYHGISSLMVSILLFVINGFVALVSHGSLAFPWALIPAAAMGFSFLSHAAIQGPRIKGLREMLVKSLGLTGSWKSLFHGKTKQAAPSGPYQELFAEALSIKAGIIDQLKKGKKRSGPLDKDLIPALDEYMGQVRLLASRAGEVDAIVDTIPMAALAEDKAELLRKEASAPNDRMRREYRKSIDEIERQERSFRELQDQREMLQLRLKSSINSLKQMRIDIARLATMPEMDEDSAVLMVKQRTSEITDYLDDLRSGLDSLDADDPFHRLEEEERKRLAAAGAAAPSPVSGDAEARLIEVRRAEMDRLGTEVGLALGSEAGDGAPAGAAAEDEEGQGGLKT